MSELLYYQDQYMKEAQATIMRIEGTRILLDRTIFIPQTSTEPGDTGEIGGFRIIGLKKDGNDVWHILQKVPALEPGSSVRLELDWDKRYQAMRLHSALHLLGSVFESRLQERAVAGVVKSSQANLVFRRALADDPIAGAVEQANLDIVSDLPVTCYWDEQREGFRWARVGNYDAIPDGGLHVRSTKEIVGIRLIGTEAEQGKQKVLFSIL